jgi:hypothetical protein
VQGCAALPSGLSPYAAGGKPAAAPPAGRIFLPHTGFRMQYEEQARRLGILGGFALGIAVGTGVALLMGGRRPVSGSTALRRARHMRAPSGRHLDGARGGAAGRMARRKFKL